MYAGKGHVRSVSFSDEDRAPVRAYSAGEESVNDNVGVKDAADGSATIRICDPTRDYQRQSA